MKDCLTVKTVRKLAMAVACVAYAACADEVPANSPEVPADSPVIYTVTTSGANTTNLLSEATVEIDDNGTVTQAAFPDVSFAANSIFRKRGEGFLKSCSGMGSFTGEVRIEEGALVINAPGQLGPSVDKSDTDPLVVVSNGASLVIATTPDVGHNALRLCGGIRIAGSGYNGIGALRSECEARAKYLFFSDLTLDSDATIVNVSAASDEDDAQWGTKSQIGVNLNGFTLTASGRRFWLNGVNFRKPAGHIVVASDGYIQLQNNITWAGTAENTITVKSGGALELYSDAKIETPWTLVLENGSQMRSRVNGSAGKIDDIYWDGPITLNGRVQVRNNGKSYGLTLRGAISGNGGFDLSNGQLDLIAENNSFAGGVSANAAGSNPLLLGLWSGTSLSSPFTATNSSLSLSSPAEYRLPPLSFHVPDGKVNCATGGIGGTAASLLKTGPGVLELTAPLAVTGGVTLAGGVLRLSSDISPYSPAPGLIESRYEVLDKTVGAELMDEWYTTGSSMNTNRVVMMPEMAEQQFNLDGYTWIRTGCEFVRYKGYIWNRADHDVTWTFAVAICPQSILYIGKDENAPESPTIERATSGNKGWKNMGLATETLSPGPHYFDLRIYSQGYDKPGARGEEFENWPTNYGFAIDFEGRGIADAANFSIPSNNVCGTIRGGDGALFTLDARTREDVTGDDYTRASFPTLDATAGTTLDLNAPGYTFTVQELSGITAVANGNLHVASKWTLSNEALDSGIPLSGDGKISFGSNWTLSVPDLGTLGLPNRRTIAVADEGGLTLPAVFDRGEDPDFAWRLELSADGKQLQLVRSRFVISIR